jgi:hypothetical protein
VFGEFFDHRRTYNVSPRGVHRLSAGQDEDAGELQNSGGVHDPNPVGETLELPHPQTTSFAIGTHRVTVVTERLTR